ncbi:MAG: acyl-CoA synthetase [Ignavibacteria bacterium CG_4_9_14_3_um_filter_36_18]|nr:MAG: acyl-CoA synthetase [Ignavibacteria bacterium CG_4_9_14_3_um_filter_36_18]
MKYDVLRSKNLECIFYPKSVAVLGANRVVGTVPHDLLDNILKSDFQGVVFPVSPKEPFIKGVKAYKYVVDIEDPVDLAVIVYASSVCHLALEQCGKKGVKAAIIISAGFKEVGEDGLKREKEVKAIADKYGISFMGPNCLGVINTDPLSNLNASFARRMPQEGNIAFLSQSGALCTAVLDYAYAKHIGFSKFVSFGNKADISEIDLLYYLKDDSKTKVILLYLEEITYGIGLMKAPREVISETGKPILILKSGRTKEGAAAAASHTGSLAGSDEICDAAFKQAGIIRCDTIEDMFNLAIAMSYQPIPAGKRVAIITNAGGPGVLATDSVIHEHLQLAKFSDETTSILKKALPKTANTKNPVDVIGDARADRYNVAITSTLKDDNVDSVFVILTPQSMTDIETIAKEVVTVAKESEKPIYTSFMGESDVAVGIDILQRNKIPHYILPESMSHACSRAYYFGQYLQKTFLEPKIFSDVDVKKANELIAEAKNKGKSFLTEYESVKILECFGLPVVDNGLASSAKEAAKVAGRIGFPVVIKIASSEIVHKSDVNGVKLNIQNETDAAEAYTSIIQSVNESKPGAKAKDVFVQKLIEPGQEVILGLKNDPVFGSVIMFGLGGIFVEILKDVSFRVAPLDRITIEEMISEIKAYKLLTAVRGRKAKDIESIITTIERLAQLAASCPQIKELDINPLIVNEEGKGCFVADAKIML